MSGDRQPRPGDRVAQPKDFVEVRYRAYFLAWSGAGDGEAFVAAGDGKFSAPPGATVEVLEPADDHKLGEIRREDHETGRSIWQLEEAYDGSKVWRCSYSTARGNRGCMYRLDNRDFDASELPIIGAVPGTAAAEQPQPLQPGPRPAPKPGHRPVGRRVPFPFEARQWMRDAARVECFSGQDPTDVIHEGVAIGLTEAPTVRVQKDDGQVVSWVLGLTRLAETYLDSLPEWEQELIREDYEKRQQPEVVDASTLFPPPVGTAPRVFTSDGPEPPEDVTILEKVDYPPGLHFPYVKRGNFGWCNCATLDEDVSGVHGFHWPPDYLASFREVIA